MGLFEQAIAIDTDYALAWAGVADCCGQMLQWETADDPKAVGVRGLEAARRAIAINPRLAEAYKAESLVLRYTGDPVASRRSLIRAIEANPKHNPSLLNLAVDVLGSSDVAGAERLVRRAAELEPQDPFAQAWLAWLFSFTGRLELAEGMFDLIRRLSDDPYYVTAAHACRIMRPLERGDLERARQAARDGLADGAERPCMKTVDAFIAAKEGRADDARRMLGELEHERIRGGWFLEVAAVAALGIGAFDLAAGYLQRRNAVALSPLVIRLTPELHPLLDRGPFAPRRSETTLVWPLEAPMMPASVHALFKEVRIESGMPKGSDLGIR